MGNRDQAAFGVCTQCLMTSSVDRSLDLQRSVCNYCREYRQNVGRRLGSGSVDQIVEKIKQRGKKGQYDCIIGVSGGVDSSFLSWRLGRLGLRLLAVHVDNGWNSESAVSNIEKVIKASGADLYTVVLNLEAFHDLQRSFLYASVPDLEIPSDHAIQAAIWKTAKKFQIPTIISGMNFASESSRNINWAYGHSDWTYIRAVWRKYGTPKPDDYPHFSLGSLLRDSSLEGRRSIALLNYMDYDKLSSVAALEANIGWKPYGPKHHESIYTRWVQGFLLPQKFGIDKRFMHLSDLVRSGQLTREEAAGQLRRVDYSEAERERDQVLVMKKLRLTEVEFNAILETEIVSFRSFSNSFRRYSMFKGMLDLARSVGVYPK